MTRRTTQTLGSAEGVSVLWDACRLSSERVGECVMPHPEKKQCFPSAVGVRGGNRHLQGQLSLA